MIAGLVSAGIPVMAHVGLRPQNIHQLGGYKVHRQEEELLADAQGRGGRRSVRGGARVHPQRHCRRLTAALEIPTIGIGAGPDCDGQVLVVNDLLGLTTGYVPKHVQQYAQLGEIMTDAVQRYCSDVREGRFPAAEQSFK